MIAASLGGGAPAENEVDLAKEARAEDEKRFQNMLKTMESSDPSVGVSNNVLAGLMSNTDLSHVFLPPPLSPFSY